MTYDWEKTLNIPAGSPAWYDEIDRRFLESAYYARGADGSPFGRFLNSETLHGKHVLEVGCGMGTHAEMLSRCAARVTVVDQTNFAAMATQRRLALRGIDAGVVRQDAERLAFQDRSFDAVWTWGVIHHSSSTERCVAEIARVLKPGGRLMMMVYYRPSLVYYLHCGLIRGVLMGQLLKRSLDQIYVAASDGYYARVFNKPELRTLLSGAFDSFQFTVFGLKAELYPIPRIRSKVALERRTPDWLADRILRHAGSMIMVEARRV